MCQTKLISAMEQNSSVMSELHSQKLVEKEKTNILNESNDSGNEDAISSDDDDLPDIESLNNRTIEKELNRSSETITPDLKDEHVDRTLTPEVNLNYYYKTRVVISGMCLFSDLFSLEGTDDIIEDDMCSFLTGKLCFIFFIYFYQFIDIKPQDFQ